MVSVAGASYNDPGQGTRGGSIILPSRFLSILNYFSIIFCDRTHNTEAGNNESVKEKQVCFSKGEVFFLLTSPLMGDPVSKYDFKICVNQ
jgi:hypothetical protein